MDAKELRAAAERYRTQDYPPSGSEWDNNWIADQERDDMRALADAYLATVKADDGEAASVAWLESVGFIRRMQPASDCKISSREFIQAENNSIIPLLAIDFPRRNKGTYVVCIYGSPKDKESAPTRGQVRRLCAALGIELKEGGAK